jgi:hypothetical protein
MPIGSFRLNSISQALSSGGGGSSAYVQNVTTAGANAGAIILTDGYFYKVHNFTTAGSGIAFNVTSVGTSNQIEYLLLGGGGGGGGAGTTGKGGGAGGGQYLIGTTTISPASSPYTVTVGTSGSGGSTAGTAGTSGGNSIAFGATAYGGGGGGGAATGQNTGGSTSGGGGGGGGLVGSSGIGTGGSSGNGFSGANAGTTPSTYGGGGGSSASTGSTSTGSTGTSSTFYSSIATANVGKGGNGQTTGSAGAAGTTNLGQGGGGSANSSSGGAGSIGRAGIRYKWSNTTALTYQSGLTIQSNGSASFTMPTVQVGDVAILFDVANNTTAVVPTQTTPSGWTSIQTTGLASGTGQRINISTKILDGTESGTTVTGMTGTGALGKIVVFYRPSVNNVTSVGLAGLNIASAQSLATQPATQTTFNGLITDAAANKYVAYALYTSTGAVSGRNSSQPATREVSNLTSLMYVKLFESIDNSTLHTSGTVSFGADYGLNTLANGIIYIA